MRRRVTFLGFLILLAFAGALPVLAGLDQWWGDSGVWDTTTPNWYNGDTITYADGDDVYFGNPDPSTVTLAQNVSPNSIACWGLDLTFSGAYSITTGALSCNGNILTLNTGANAFSSVSVNGYGTISAPNAAALGVYSTSAPTISVGASAKLAVRAGGSNQWTQSDIATLLGGATTFATNGSFAIDTTDGNFAYSNNITGPLAFVKLGGNTLTLSGANTYTGATTVSAGTLQLGANNALPTGQTVNLSTGATLDLNGHSQTLVSLSGGGTTVSLGPTGSTGTLTVTGTYVEYDGVITGVGSFVKQGAGGAFTLGGQSIYTGATTVSSGTLQSSVSNALPSATALTVNSGGTFSVGAGVNQQIASLSGSGTVMHATTGTSFGTLTVGDPTQVISSTFTGAIGTTVSATKKVYLTKVGGGTLTLSGLNLYTGTTTVSAGTLDLVGTSTSGTATEGAWYPVLNLSGANVNGGALVFDYSGTGGADPITAVNTARSSNKIYSSKTGSNVWVIVDNTVAKKVTVGYTLLGDANLDNIVDGTDLNIVLSNYGATSGATWLTGDFNGGGAVYGTDLNDVLSNYGSVSSVTSAVPEPSTLLLAAAGLIGLLAYAWRKK